MSEMEAETSWISHCVEDSSREVVVELEPYSEAGESDGGGCGTVSVDLILPDDLLERILAFLPVVSIFRAGCVCKRWHEIVSSERFLWSFSSSQAPSQKPWYFMFTSSKDPMGHAYDPALRKWYGLELPCVRAPSWCIASSRGLVCSMDRDGGGEVRICNPITGQRRRLGEPPGPRFPDYAALAVSSSRREYGVSVVKSKQVPGEFFQWDVSVHMYDSCTQAWETPMAEVLIGWRAGHESVICDGMLYFLVYSTGGGGGGGPAAEGRHGLVGYKIGTWGPLMRSFVGVPCALTCGRLMNLREKLVMVGGIGKADRPDIIKGIGIWVLTSGGKGGMEWREVGRMPHKFFQGFGELDDVFASSGVDDVVYIQSYGAPALLMYDMAHKHWKWSQKCPVTKRFPLQLFTGFCFEPRLEITP